MLIWIQLGFTWGILTRFSLFQVSTIRYSMAVLCLPLIVPRSPPPPSSPTWRWGSDCRGTCPSPACSCATVRESRLSHTSSKPSWGPPTLSPLEEFVYKSLWPLLLWQSGTFWLLKPRLCRSPELELSLAKQSLQEKESFHTLHIQSQALGGSI